MRASPHVVDADVLLRKGLAIEHHTARLRAKMPLDATALADDESRRNDVCFDAMQAIQATIDLAVHTCAHEALGVPAGPAAAFTLLARHHVIAGEHAIRLAAAAGLRNLIVHQYADVETPRLIRALEAGLNDLDEFLRALRRHAGR